jgi:hypothetical protein
MGAGVSAWGDTVSFDFRGAANTTYLDTSLTFAGDPTSSGVSVNVTALEDGSPTAGSLPVLVTQTEFGLGVLPQSEVTFTPGDFVPGAYQLDGSRPNMNLNESLVFTFKPNAVRLDVLTFTFADANDDLQLQIAGGSGSPIRLDLNPTAGEFYSYTLDLNSVVPSIPDADRTGLTFTLSTLGADDNVSIAGLSVGYSPTPAAVPLPGVAWAGLALFGGLGGARGFQFLRARRG